MTELAIEMENAAGAHTRAKGEPAPRKGSALARWDDAFAEALLRLLQLGDDPNGHSGPSATRDCASCTTRF